MPNEAQFYEVRLRRDDLLAQLPLPGSRRLGVPVVPGGRLVGLAGPGRCGLSPAGPGPGGDDASNRRG